MSCSTGKVQYPTAWAAKRARDRIGDRALLVYECRTCAGFHLGHAPRKRFVTTRKGLVR